MTTDRQRSSRDRATSPPEDVLAGLPPRYQSTQELARGGMSAVYLAEDREAARDVVLKVSTISGFGDKSVERFLREARAIKRLQHPNIVKIFDSFRCGEDRYVLVLEYIEGETLAKRIREDGPMPLREFIPVASQVIKALEYAHARNTILRDIKPENVMLSARDGYRDVVTLIDFGLARTLGMNDQVTRDDVIAGTVGFMSPEEITGSSPVDARSDVYALGSMFYYMLSGKMLFEGQPASVLFQQGTTSPRPLAESLGPGHGLPVSLLELIDSCIRRSPSERPESAIEVMGGLIDVVPATAFRLRRAASRASASRPSMAARLAPPTEETQERPWSAAKWGLIALLGLAVIGGAFALGAMSDQETSDPVKTVEAVEAVEAPQPPTEPSQSPAAPEFRAAQAPQVDDKPTATPRAAQEPQAADVAEAEAEAVASRPPSPRPSRRSPRRSRGRRRSGHGTQGAETAVESPAIDPAQEVPDSQPTAPEPPHARKLEDGLRRSPF